MRAEDIKPRTKLEPWWPKLEPWPGKLDGRRYLEGCRRMVDQLAAVIAVREEREYEAAVMAWESEGGR